MVGCQWRLLWYSDTQNLPRLTHREQMVFFFHNIDIDDLTSISKQTLATILYKNIKIIYKLMSCKIFKKKPIWKMTDHFIQKRRLEIVICLLLVMVSTLIYFQLNGFEFVTYDDELYITKNPYIKAGFTRESIAVQF